MHFLKQQDQPNTGCIYLCTLQADYGSETCVNHAAMSTLTIAHAAMSMLTTTYCNGIISIALLWSCVHIQLLVLCPRKQTMV